MHVENNSGLGEFRFPSRPDKHVIVTILLPLLQVSTITQAFIHRRSSVYYAVAYDDPLLGSETGLGSSSTRPNSAGGDRHTNPFSPRYLVVPPLVIRIVA